jgi:hypothetical protein
MKYLISILILTFVYACSEKASSKEQSISLKEIDSLNFDISQGLDTKNSQNSLTSAPNEIILTGMNDVRLFSIYQIHANSNKNILYDEGTTYNNSEEIEEEDNFKYFMPGIDIIKGYNLINIGHYSVSKDTLTYFFDKPVLVKTLYFPGLRPDSLLGKAAKRNFFLVSAYTKDSNKDSLINNKDLRQFYFINADNSQKLELLPDNTSAIRSLYDYKNDFMFIHARIDLNKDGAASPLEPVSIYLLDLKMPTQVKRVY